MAFPSTKLDLKVEIALSADLTDVNMNWSWTDATAYFLVSDLIVITRGRGDEYSSAAPATCRLTVINTDGRWCRTNPTGAWYGQLSKNTPLRVRVNGGSGYVTRFTGFIDELPPRWDKSGRFAYVPITASGILRRIKQGRAFRSALFRAHTGGYFSSGSAVAYWPCEDGSGSGLIASGIGGPPMSFSGDQFALGSDSSIAGSDPLPVLGENGYLTGPVPVYPASTSWAIRFVMKIPTGDAGVLLFWDTPTGSGNVAWRFSLDSGTDQVHIAAYNSAGTDVIADAGVTVTGIRDKQIYIEINATQNGTGTGIDWDYNVWLPYGVGYGKIGTLASSTVANVTRVIAFAGVAALGNSTMGHIAVSTDTAFGAGVYGATGFAGEGTWFRFLRILAEENIAWNSFSLDLPSTAMGAQSTTDLQGQLAEIEATEAAPIYDGFDGSVTATNRRDRQNAAVALTLDFDASQVAEAPEPTDDDQQLHNDVTVTRVGGSVGARATETTGPNSTAIGVYSAQVTVNTASDDVLLSHASWLLNLGTVDDLRFPRVDLNLARATSKIADWLACDVNSRIQLTNPPSQLAPDTIDLILEGYTETLGPFTWQVQANCSPAAPWNVFKVEDASLGRLETAGSYLLSGYTSGATSLTVGTTAGPKWSTSAVPYGWRIAGERVTVTAVSNVTSAFVAAGTAQHADNASVTPGMPAGVQQDDLLLVLAAIRSSGTGTVNTPSGYTALLTFGNVVLLAKIHSGSESAPTVTFTGGSAGDTTSAQMAAFRGVQALVDSSATQLNGSAQNIAVPTMTGPTRPNTLFLWLGWKQDDWTSVATLSGGFATEIGEPSSTTGNDQGLVWDYFFQGNAGQPGSTSFVVTGGASAISRSAVLALVTDVQTATVTRAVNGVTKAQSANASVSLWRPGVLAL